MNATKYMYSQKIRTTVPEKTEKTPFLPALAQARPDGKMYLFKF